MFNDEWKFENCAHGQVKKHPTDCSKYLTCSFGVYLQEQKCPGGLHFSEVRINHVTPNTEKACDSEDEREF